jgi:predicted esterase
MCADSSWTCDWLQYFAMAPQWQICPRAPRTCDGAGYQWPVAPKDSRRVVEAAIAAAKERHGARVLDDAVVLAGFSQGAYTIATLVHDLAVNPAPYRVKGILVQGAHVHFSVPDLRKLGVRVVFVDGEQDATAAAMRAEADRLRRQGIEARYVSLGNSEGHFISPSTGNTVAELIDWCRGRGQP